MRKLKTTESKKKRERIDIIRKKNKQLPLFFKKYNPLVSFVTQKKKNTNYNPMTEPTNIKWNIIFKSMNMW